MKRKGMIIAALCLFSLLSGCGKLSQEHIHSLWESFGLKGQSPQEALEEAKAGGEIVTVQSDLWTKREKLDQFYEASLRGEKGQLLILNYYEMEGKKPEAFLSRISFDGEKYTQEIRRTEEKEGIEGSGRSFRYLVHYTGETKAPARPLKYEHYVLVDDNTVTWERLEWGMLSSQFGDATPFGLVASSYTPIE